MPLLIQRVVTHQERLPLKLDPGPAHQRRVVLRKVYADCCARASLFSDVGSVPPLKWPHAAAAAPKRLYRISMDVVILTNARLLAEHPAKTISARSNSNRLVPPQQRLNIAKTQVALSAM